MPIEVQVISTDQADQLLALQEGHFQDLKSKRIAPAKLSESLAAFGNADGGELFVGLEDAKESGDRWQGFATQEKTNGHIQAFEGPFPLGEVASYEFLSCEEQVGLVLHIIIPKSRRILKDTGGTIRLRRGSQNLPVTTPEAIRTLELRKGILSYESETVGIDPRVVTNSTVAIEFMLSVVPNSEPEGWFVSQQLVQSEKPTVAAVLLFAQEPQAILPKRCGIKLYRYKTSGEDSRETLAGQPITIEGWVHTQITKAVDQTVAMVQESQVLGTTGLESVNYPAEALHEIITNAVLHRDYQLADDVHIRVYDNRIEIQSPGRLPAHITPENILKERYSRNGNLVRIVNKFPNPPNKDVGEGLNTAFEAMRKLKLKSPTIVEIEHGVLVTLRHEPLASPEEAILEYLEKNPKINNSKAREICHIGSESIMQKVFVRMMSSGLIEKMPELKGRAQAYRKL